MTLGAVAGYGRPSQTCLAWKSADLLTKMTKASLQQARISPLDTVLSIRKGKACDISRPSCEASGGLQLLLARSWSHPSPPKCRDCRCTLGCEPDCSPLFLFLPLLDLARAEAKFQLPNIYR